MDFTVRIFILQIFKYRRPPAVLRNSETRKQMNYKISNGKILLTGPDRLETAERDLYILDGRISFGPAGLPEESFEVIDAARHLVMPGLINMHTHAYMTLMRNYADDVGFDEWLFKRVMPVEDTLPLEGAYWGSLLACMEMIRTGTTTFMDMHMFRGQSCRAALETGMRAWIGRGLVGEDLYGDGLSRFRQGLEEQAEYECGRIRFTLAPHAIYSCGPKLLEQVAREAADRGMRKQIHLSESDNEVNDALRKYGKTPVALLRDTGFLDEKTILAHCVKMRGDDISIIKEAGATVVTNPASNAKLGNGFAPLQDFLDAGIQVCLGTDGTCSNNTLNMFREMGLVSLIHKGIHRNPVTAPADTVVRMATANAGRALGLPEELGVIAEGALADLVFLDLDAPSMFPVNNPVSALCYSACGSEVDSVMIDGSFVMRKGEYTSIDAERVRYEVQKAVDQYL